MFYNIINNMVSSITKYKEIKEIRLYSMGSFRSISPNDGNRIIHNLAISRLFYIIIFFIPYLLYAQNDLTGKNLNLSTATSTSGNIKIGQWNALNMYGSKNIYVGNAGNFTSPNADSNAVLGFGALRNIASGSRNVAIGAYAGGRLDHADGTVWIGNEAGNNSVFAGLDGIGGIDNTNTDCPLIRFDFNNDTVYICGYLKVDESNISGGPGAVDTLWYIDSGKIRNVNRKDVVIDSALYLTGLKSVSRVGYLLAWKSTTGNVHPVIVDILKDSIPQYWHNEDGIIVNNDNMPVVIRADSNLLTFMTNGDEVTGKSIINFEDSSGDTAVAGLVVRSDNNKAGIIDLYFRQGMGTNFERLFSIGNSYTNDESLLKVYSPYVEEADIADYTVLYNSDTKNITFKSGIPIFVGEEVEELNDLSDVTLDNPDSGDILRFDDEVMEWTNVPMPEFASLSDSSLHEQVEYSIRTKDTTLMNIIGEVDASLINNLNYAYLNVFNNHTPTSPVYNVALQGVNYLSSYKDDGYTKSSAFAIVSDHDQCFNIMFSKFGINSTDGGGTLVINMTVSDYDVNHGLPNNPYGEVAMSYSVQWDGSTFSVIDSSSIRNLGDLKDYIFIASPRKYGDAVFDTIVVPVFTRFGYETSLFTNLEFYGGEINGLWTGVATGISCTDEVSCIYPDKDNYLDIWSKTGNTVHLTDTTGIVGIKTRNALADLHVDGSKFIKGGNGDFDNDGEVFSADLDHWLNDFGNPDSINTPDKFARLDIDGNGELNATDYYILSNALYPDFNLEDNLQDADRLKYRVLAGTHNGVVNDSVYAFFKRLYLPGIPTVNESDYHITMSNGLLEKIPSENTPTYDSIMNLINESSTTSHWDIHSGTQDTLYNTLGDILKLNIPIISYGNIQTQRNYSNTFLGVDTPTDSYQDMAGDNTAIGNNSMNAWTSGQMNTAIGSQSQYKIDNGELNTSIGSYSLANNVSGQMNVAIGSSAGSASTGNSNIFIGYNSGSIYDAIDNKLIIEPSDADTNNALIFGNFATDNLTINGNLKVTRLDSASTSYSLYYDNTTGKITYDSVGRNIINDDTSKWDKVGNYISPKHGADSVLIGFGVIENGGAPMAPLDVNGTAIIRDELTVQKINEVDVVKFHPNEYIEESSDEVLGAVYTNESDSTLRFYNGEEWEILNGNTTIGDNLGNHIASQELNMAGNDIVGADTIIASGLEVDGIAYLDAIVTPGFINFASTATIECVNNNDLTINTGTGNLKIPSLPLDTGIDTLLVIEGQVIKKQASNYLSSLPSSVLEWSDTNNVNGVGIATYDDLQNLSLSGDNLGDHTATTTLDLNANPIIDASALYVGQSTGTATAEFYNSEDKDIASFTRAITSTGTVGAGVGINFQRARLGMTSVAAGDMLGLIRGRGYDGTTFDNVTNLQMLAQTVNSGNIGGQFIFKTSNYSGTVRSHLWINSNGRVGIETSAPDKMLEVSDTTGQCLRLTYNDQNGSAANYSDLTVSSSGDLTIAASGGDVAISSNLDMKDYNIINVDSLEVEEYTKTQELRMDSPLEFLQSMRRKPFFWNDFLYTEVGEYYPWYGIAISSGSSTGLTSGLGEHPGVIELRSASSGTNTGYQIRTNATGIILEPGSYIEMVFKVNVTTNSTIYFGFHNTQTVTAPTTGAWITITGTTLDGHNANSGTVATGTSYSITKGTWYRCSVYLNDVGNATYFKLYDMNEAVLWSESLATYLPTSSTPLHCGVQATNSGTSQYILHLDYMALTFGILTR